MSKISPLSFQKSLFWILLIIILLIPTYLTMFKPGIFSMHDFHLIRLYQYHQCIVDLQIPCRWAIDAAFGYGQPMFNFYGQMPYVYGELFRFLGFSVIDTIKILFSLSFILSGIFMFFLGRQLWGNNLAALVSAMVYVYAPYRAVDVYVRGALPEALAFVFFPAITYFFNSYINDRKRLSLLLFGLTFSLLILTHNLSALMYVIFFSFWGVFCIFINKAWKLVPNFILAGVLSIGLVSFYVLPVVYESNLTTLQKTTGGYYDYKNHYLTLNQLLISRYWGYGGSLWGEDDRLSLSVGHVQWILPTIVLIFLLVKGKTRQSLVFILLYFIGWFMLFLTHNKSTPIWDALKPIAFVQFPWRFLGSAVFAFAVCSGVIINIFTNKKIKMFLVISIISILFLLNMNFYKEDIWYNHKDSDEFSGERLEFHLSSAVTDFWPSYAKESPTSLAPEDPIFIEASGSGKLIEKRSNLVLYQLNVDSPGKISFPLVYFPNWEGYIDDQMIDLYPNGDLALSTAFLPIGEYKVKLVFRDTLIRQLGNYISLGSLFLLLYLMFYEIKRKKRL